MPDIDRASLRPVCVMAVPFKIPKKKQGPDTCSLDMQSPLSRLQDVNLQKSQWGSLNVNGWTSQSSNGNEPSKASEGSQSLRPIRPLTLGSERREASTPSRITHTSSRNAPRGTTRPAVSFKMNKQPIKINPTRLNGMPAKVSETFRLRPQSQNPETGRDFTGNSRWRPKRASDTLLSTDENHSRDSESSSFKICRGPDLGELKTNELSQDNEDEDNTQSYSERNKTSEACKPASTRPLSLNCQDTLRKFKTGATTKEKLTSKSSAQNSSLHSDRSVEEAPTTASGERAATNVPAKKEPQTSGSLQDPLMAVYKRIRRKTTYKKAKPRSSEPIVLSSDEEGVEEINGVSGSLQEQRISEGIRDAQAKTAEGLRPKVGVPSIMELEFNRLHYNTVKAQGNGTIVITEDGISIPLKGEDGDEEENVNISCSQLLLYGLWDGALARDGHLLSTEEEPAPSLLFLMVSDAQARLLQKDLSLLNAGHTLGAPCPFLLLVLGGQLEDLQKAMLASLMDLIGLRFGVEALSNGLPWAEGLRQLHSHTRGENFLSLLGQNISHKGDDKTETNSCGTSRFFKEPAERRPLRSNSKQQSSPRRLIQYPPPPSKGGITVTTEDLECLKEGEFLNDVIIDFYLKYLLLKKADKDVAERSHIFSSFFYKQLTRKDTRGPEETGSTAAHRRHQRVRTWTRHVDIFSKDFLFIPVNHEAHWYLVVICFPGLEKPESVQRRNKGLVLQEESQTTSVSSTGASQPEKAQSKGNGLTHSENCTEHNCTRETVCRRPCILLMDSLKLSYHQHVCTLLREYLQVEWELRKGSTRSFNSERVCGSLCRVPQQDNSSDCGLYLLHYVQSFLQNPVVHFDLPLRLEHWFPRSQVRRKRAELRELVLELYRRQGGRTDLV